MSGIWLLGWVLVIFDFLKKENTDDVEQGPEDKELQDKEHVRERATGGCFLEG